MTLRITDGDILVESAENQNSILVPDLKETKNYELEFTPSGSGIPSRVKAFSATLVLRKYRKGRSVKIILGILFFTTFPETK